MAVDSIQVAFKIVALSYTKGVLIYKAGRSNKGLEAMGQVFANGAGVALR
jgi:hypothetical protein